MEIDRFVREPERKQLTAIHTSTWYEQVAAGLAPPAVKLSERAVAWPYSELAALNAARVAGKGDEEIRALVKRLVAARARAFDQFDAA